MKLRNTETKKPVNVGDVVAFNGKYRTVTKIAPGSVVIAAHLFNPYVATEYKTVDPEDIGAEVF